MVYVTDLKIGETVITDIGKPNSCEVEILSFNENKSCAIVKAKDNYEYEIPTRRLTKIDGVVGDVILDEYDCCGNLPTKLCRDCPLKHNH